MLTLARTGSREDRYKEFYDLDNGLGHVIMIKNNTTPIVITSVYINLAQKMTADRTGFAHFFEHWVWRISKISSEAENTE